MVRALTGLFLRRRGGSGVGLAGGTTQPTIPLQSLLNGATPRLNLYGSVTGQSAPHTRLPEYRRRGKPKIFSKPLKLLAKSSINGTREYH
jgi:hypothetical protein